MKIGFVGCGKLGLMVALAIESKGHEVKGYDVNTQIANYFAGAPYPYQEEGAAELFQKSKMEMVSLEELCRWADILFLAPQTPHEAQYEGDRPLPSTRADFNYSYLKQCICDVRAYLVRPTTCVLISTVLPGTLEREVLPLLDDRFRLVYEPLFIAMGTVVRDFLNPEFVLVGLHDKEAAAELQRFYATIHNRPLFITDIKTAEGIKVFYNTFITAKTVLANLYGEMAARLGMNVDDIYQALSLATDRLISPKYLKAGMGDGGGCHPRDNIALSYIAQKCELSFDFFSALMTAREKHVEWLASLIKQYKGDLPVYLLGRAFKPETNIETGSPAVLLSRILQREGIPHGSQEYHVPIVPALYFIGTRHERWAKIKFPAGSVVIDPFRYISEQKDVTVLRIGDGTILPKKLRKKLKTAVAVA
jgi:UDPglucose 6-dehydrogenase